MDDSTSYQVYNKVAETEESIQAVDETHGQVLAYEGNVLEAYYFPPRRDTQTPRRSGMMPEILPMDICTNSV